MNLVPTLQNVVVQVAIAQDFWDNHRKCQDDLDRQNEGMTSSNEDELLFQDRFLRMLGLAPVLRVSRIDLTKMYPAGNQ